MRVRRRPSMRRSTTRCSTTMIVVFTAKAMPRLRVDTRATAFAYAAHPPSTCPYPTNDAMNDSARSRRNTRSASTTR